MLLLLPPGIVPLAWVVATRVTSLLLIQMQSESVLFKTADHTLLLLMVKGACTWKDLGLTIKLLTQTLESVSISGLQVMKSWVPQTQANTTR